MLPALRQAPFTLGTGPLGVLCIHGFTGTPADLRDLALQLVDAGHTVTNVRLAGHADSEVALAATRWPDWWHSVLSAYLELRNRCARVVVVGFSMGGLLALKLAAHYPLDGAAILAAPLFLRKLSWHLVPVLSHVVRYRPRTPVSIREPLAHARQSNPGRTPMVCLASFRELMANVNTLVPSVRCPLLLVYSAADGTVPFDNQAYLAGRVHSLSVQTVSLHDSDHVVTLDGEHATVEAAVVTFVNQRAMGGES